ncbi:MAG TPA: GNAT family N-acetyltransferase, partial [Burkholderiales bacterium]
HLLPQTGIPYDWEKRLSASFIVSPAYGTRASSVRRLKPWYAEADRAMLNAQVRAVIFYRRFGFEPEGETFLDAGIPHIAMSRPL